LVLDEPTNDLDLMTLGVLEDALSEFPGCALVVSVTIAGFSIMSRPASLPLKGMARSRSMKATTATISNGHAPALPL
jgi:hypothetical protein